MPLHNEKKGELTHWELQTNTKGFIRMNETWISSSFQTYKLYSCIWNSRVFDEYPQMTEKMKSVKWGHTCPLLLSMFWTNHLQYIHPTPLELFSEYSGITIWGKLAEKKISVSYMLSFTICMYFPRNVNNATSNFKKLTINKAYEKHRD